jgi:hypothetical protein
VIFPFPACELRVRPPETKEAPAFPALFTHSTAMTAQGIPPLAAHGAPSRAASRNLPSPIGPGRSRRQGVGPRSDADPRAIPLSVSPKGESFQERERTRSDRNSPGASSSGVRSLSKKEEKRARGIRERTRKNYRINPEVPE